MDGMVNENPFSLFKGKRILITGDTGFKGSWLSLWLHELGAEVVGYALPPERKEDHFNMIGLGQLTRHVDGDIRDFASLKKVIDEFRPEFLFHLAAQALVRFSYEEPKLTFDTNVGGSINILEISQNSPSLRVLIYVTSDKCYRNRGWVWGYRENDELGGRDPYSASKAAAEVVFSAYMDSFFSKRQDFGASSVRAGNVIGGGDWAPDRIVPDCIRALQKGKPILIRNPNSTRPWQHVLEPLSGYLVLAARLYNTPKIYSGSWNFGPREDSMKTVQDLVKEIIECWGGGEIETNHEEDAPHEALMLHLNWDKAYQVLGWKPRWDFRRAVVKTVQWYKEVFSGDSAIKITREQIKDYMGA
jgi:CDP-glucose 4,6-dehydratase